MTNDPIRKIHLGADVLENLMGVAQGKANPEIKRMIDRMTALHSENEVLTVDHLPAIIGDSKPASGPMVAVSRVLNRIAKAGSFGVSPLMESTLEALRSEIRADVFDTEGYTKHMKHVEDYQLKKPEREIKLHVRGDFANKFVEFLQRVGYEAAGGSGIEISAESGGGRIALLLDGDGADGLSVESYEIIQKKDK